MKPVIQCVPNFSEGRDKSKVEAITDAVRGVSSVNLIDYSSDPDHNRSVLTYLGDAEGVREASLAVAKRAVELIDLRLHTGGHPRIGAIDVLPLVPIRGITMAECVEASRKIGREIAESLGLPVYFYEESAVQANRINLANVRRGGYERLAQVGLTGDRAPDAGPNALHPSAGAVVVGARGPLVAFNVNLDSDDLEVAADIARKVRKSEALPGVKAIGVCLESRGRVQVSMNVTRPDLVTLPEVFAFVAREAREYGVRADESEVIGAIPARVLAGESPGSLKIRDFKQTQILEHWLT